MLNKYELTKKDGKVYLFDEKDYNSVASRLEEINEIYKTIPQLLKDNSQKADEATVIGYAKKGVAFLNKQIRESFEEWAKSDSAPRYLNVVSLEALIRPALDAIPNKLVTEYSEINYKVCTIIQNTLIGSIQDDEYIFRGNYFGIDIDKILSRVWGRYAIEISPEDMKVAKRIVKIIDEIKSLEDEGYILNPCEEIRQIYGDFRKLSWRGILPTACGDSYNPEKRPEVSESLVLQLMTENRRDPYKVKEEE